MAKRKKHIVAGACPRCGSVDTEIVVDGLSARGKCKACGFEDQKLTVESEDDLALAVQLAGQSFSTVIVGAVDDDDGYPNVYDLAHDIAQLMRLVCKSSDCCSCPLDAAAPSKPDSETGHGGFVFGSKLGLVCQDQVESRCASKLIESYPAYSLQG